MAGELSRAVADLGALALQLGDRERPAGHPRAVLVGPPNSGKSRLFNALLGRERAIVAGVAGTTRDYLSELCVCEGLTVELVDTAGIETPLDAVTTQAQALRALQARGADLLLDCRSAQTAALATWALEPARPRLHVWTKADQALPDPGHYDTIVPIVTSAVTGTGLDTLRLAIAQTIERQQSEGNVIAGTGARCRGSIHLAAEALRSAASTLVDGRGEELVVFDLRVALDELGKVVGAVVTDDILDRIFRRFCIGK
jgi:tRNA modification GTPase